MFPREAASLLTSRLREHVTVHREADLRRVSVASEPEEKPLLPRYDCNGYLQNSGGVHGDFAGLKFSRISF